MNVSYGSQRTNEKWLEKPSGGYAASARRESAMSKFYEFKFADGSPHNKSALADSRTGVIGGWTKQDFVTAVNVHAKAFGPSMTRDAIASVIHTDISQMPSYAYGAIIATLAAEMTATKQNNIPRAPLYIGKKDDA